MTKPARIPMLSFFLRGGTKSVLLKAGVLIAVIAFADWRADKDVTLGFLYLFPMLMVGSVLKRWQIAIVAALCTFLAEIFDSFDWRPSAGIPRDILIFSAFLGMGLFVYEVVRSRQAALTAFETNRIGKRSPPRGRRTVEGAGGQQPGGHLHRRYRRPVLAGQRRRAPPVRPTARLAPGQVDSPISSIAGERPGSRTERPVVPHRHAVPRPASGRGSLPRRHLVFHLPHQRRARGWPPWWWTPPKICAIAKSTACTSFWLLRAFWWARSRTKFATSAAPSRVVHENLARNSSLANNKDFEALGTLIQTLEKIAALELRQTPYPAARVDLPALLEELRIVIEAALREEGIDVSWDIEPGLPAVWADRQSLMQVFLNLTKNSQRAMLDQPSRQLKIVARAEGHRVAVRVQDTGGGVLHPEHLFRPFQPGAQSTGLGVYLSRALLRSFRGDLRYEPEPRGWRSVVPRLSSNFRLRQPVT